MEHPMNKRIGVLFFSPTNTTKKICIAIASGMGADDPLILDMTHPDTRSDIIANANTVLDEIDHLIAGVFIGGKRLIYPRLRKNHNIWKRS